MKAFLSFTLQRLGSWLWWYLGIMVLFYAFARPVWLAVIVHAVTTAWGLFGSWLQYRKR